MSEVLTIRDLINLWPTRAILASDVNKIAGGPVVSAGQVHKWAQAQSIPPRFHLAVVQSAQGRRFQITAELVVTLHAFGARSDAA